MQLRGRHWLAGTFVATALHVSGFTVLFWQDDESGAVSAGIGGIEVALGPAGGAPGAAAMESVSEDATAEQAKSEQLLEPLEMETAKVQPMETTPPEPIPDDTPLVEAEPEQTPVTPDVPPESMIPDEPAIEPKVEPDQEPPVETAAAPVIQPPPPREKPKPPLAEQPPPIPIPQVEPSVVQTQNRPQPTLIKDVVNTVAMSAPSGAAGKSGTLDSRDAGSSIDSYSGGGIPGAQADYAATLLAWLERHKKYPRRAQRRRQEGVVLLYIEIDRSGQILNHRVQRSSGFRALDDATIDMLKRAKPLPPLPDDMDSERLEIIVPVQFFIA